MTEQVYGNSEGCFMKRCIIIHHQLKTQFFATFFRKCGTDETAAMLRHEIYDFRCNIPGSGDKVPFVFTVLIIYDNHEFSVLYILNGTFNRIEHVAVFCKIKTIVGGTCSRVIQAAKTGVRLS